MLPEALREVNRAFWVAHASRVSGDRVSRSRTFLKDRFGETPKPARGTRALPRKLATTRSDSKLVAAPPVFPSLAHRAARRSPGSVRPAVRRVDVAWAR